jgi:hypothetical protein
MFVVITTVNPAPSRLLRSIVRIGQIPKGIAIVAALEIPFKLLRHYLPPNPRSEAESARLGYFSLASVFTWESGRRAGDRQ